MGHKDKIKRLERTFGGERWDLVCPVCGWETTVYGDVWVELIVYDWTKYQWEHGIEEYGDPKKKHHPSVVELAEHEHDGEDFDFIEKRSGLPLHHPSVSGMNWDVGPKAHQSDEDGL